ncbi:MAG: hypothetical protein ACRD3B_09470 [Candidatus Sulfotelmatobacter sp.]
MKNPLLLAVLLFIAMTAGTASGQDRDGSGASSRFVGAWRLASLEEAGADGKVHKADCTGQFVFTTDGHASVQVMYRNPPAETNAAPGPYAQGGYERPSAPIRSMMLILSRSTSKARWCGRSSEKI